jgi:hypothetical protein
MELYVPDLILRGGFATHFLAKVNIKLFEIFTVLKIKIHVLYSCRQTWFL